MKNKQVRTTIINRNELALSPARVVQTSHVLLYDPLYEESWKTKNEKRMVFMYNSAQEKTGEKLLQGGIAASYDREKEEEVTRQE